MIMILVRIALLLFPFVLFSQENDFQIWTAVSSSADLNIIETPIDLKKKAKRKLTFTIKQGYRFRENSSLLTKQFTDVRFKFKLSKRLSTAIGYRYTFDWNQPLETTQHLFYPYVQNRNRYYSDIYYNKKIRKRLSLNLRTRYLYQENIFRYENLIRKKMTVSYNIRKTKIEPSLSMESFYNLSNTFEKMRYTFGFTYPFVKKIDFDIAYRIQQEFNVNNPITLFIFDLKLAYKL